MVAARSITRSRTKETNDRIRRTEVARPLGSSSVNKGQVRIASEEGLLVQGTALTTGTQTVEGLLQGSGTFDWTGPMNNSGPFINTGPFTNTGDFSNTGPFTNSGKFTNSGELEQNGPVKLNGATEITSTLDVTATTRLRAATTVEDDLSVTSSGTITVGGLTLDPGGTYGGQIVASSVLVLSAATTTASNDLTVLSDARIFGDATVTGNLTVQGAKSFRIPHPTQPNKWLQYGSTESPVSGIEYHGTAELDQDGETTVSLPDYFEHLAKREGRSIFITGRGFLPGWSDIVDGKFQVSGIANGKFSWLVKAERVGGDFQSERYMTPEELELAENPSAA